MLNSGEPELFADQEAARTSVEEELARDMVMMAQFEEQMRQWERERRERRLRDPQCFGPEAVDRTAAWLRAGLASAQAAGSSREKEIAELQEMLDMIPRWRSREEEEERRLKEEAQLGLARAMDVAAAPAHGEVEEERRSRRLD
ncbi:unnamed protein product [Linum tenue]|uniref:Uncharacterized protein n=1 Tax=Linum tenue TaxID=586396 RepID=A0AAV0KGQ3_9ROSI|nr:unnamed protein product [Linum tenue]